MSEETTFLTPQAVAKQLDISPATLRRWADEFSDYLSPQATSDQGRSHRRYGEEDMATLTAVKALMNNGMTYEQARQELAQFAVSAGQKPSLSSEPQVDGGDGAGNDWAGDDVGTGEEYRVDQAETDNLEQRFNILEDDPDEDEDTALVIANGSESAAVAFLTNTLATLSDTQKSILNSQAANRELLGVLIQDNFNLKEENNRLRERILEVERSQAQGRQEEEWRLESLRQELEAKIVSAQHLATEALTTAQNVEAPEIKAVKSKPGCLGALFGAGDTQIITTRPRRRSRDGRETPSAGASRPAGPPYASPPPPQQHQADHPRPTSLPE